MGQIIAQNLVNFCCQILYAPWCSPPQFQPKISCSLDFFYVTLGGFLNCGRCFFPKNLALVWHWSGNDFVKAVPKNMLFFIARFMNLWAAHKDQLLANKVHSPTPQILCPQYTTTMVSVLHRQQSTKSSSRRNGDGGDGNGGSDGDSKNNQLKVAAKNCSGSDGGGTDNNQL